MCERIFCYTQQWLPTQSQESNPRWTSPRPWQMFDRAFKKMTHGRRCSKGLTGFTGLRKLDNHCLGTTIPGANHRLIVSDESNGSVFCFCKWPLHKLVWQTDWRDHWREEWDHLDGCWMDIYGSASVCDYNICRILPSLTHCQFLHNVGCWCHLSQIQTCTEEIPGAAWSCPCNWPFFKPRIEDLMGAVFCVQWICSLWSLSSFVLLDLVCCADIHLCWMLAWQQKVNWAGVLACLRDIECTQCGYESLATKWASRDMRNTSRSRIISMCWRISLASDYSTLALAKTFLAVVDLEKGNHTILWSI